MKIALFFIGMLVGIMIGITRMCLLQINRMEEQ